VGSARRVVAAWPFWELPRWLQMVVAGVIAAYCAAIGGAAAVTHLRAGDLELFAILVACGAVTVEVTRRVGETGGVIRDMYAIWDLPAAVLLPPLYALLVPIPRMILTQVRIRRIQPHRRAYTAGAVGLAYAAASLTFHAGAPALGGTGTGMGLRALEWTLLAAACGVLRLAINDTLILTAVKGSAPKTRLRPEILGGEALYNDVAELSLGVLAAFAAAHSKLLVLYALPLVISLQRSLRHSQLVSASRIDSKTGLLNDPTWRREAAAEVARAVRTRTSVAVAMVDIDHFKVVNDTYGHLAGDAVLTAIAAATKALLRDYDIVGRVGGEEFAVLLPHTSIGEARDVTERLREKIPRIVIPSGGPVDAVPSGVTVSIGVAAARRPRGDLGRFLALADEALYAAKAAGRNRVHVVTNEDPGSIG
jgi:diguanylate cyclase (GGDEF)-like protein